MKNLIHRVILKVICIKIKVYRNWSNVEKSQAVSYLCLFGIKVCELNTRRATKTEFFRTLKIN